MARKKIKQLDFSRIDVSFALDEPFATELLHFAEANAANSQAEALKLLIMSFLAQTPQMGLDIGQSLRAYNNMRGWAFLELQKALIDIRARVDEGLRAGFFERTNESQTGLLQDRVWSAG